jgi:hypothetical protein
MTVKEIQIYVGASLGCKVCDLYWAPGNNASPAFFFASAALVQESAQRFPRSQGFKTHYRKH